MSEVQGWLDPPGCETDFVASPNGRRDRCCTVGIVHEHRFAFFYWAIFSTEQARRNPADLQQRPILITVDYHGDVGGDCDFRPEELESLDLVDRTELGLFCWCRLRALNDGQIAPALYLNMFSDVYVLLKQGREDRRLYPEESTQQQRDRYGMLHEIWYFDRAANLLSAVPRDGRPIYLDIDLDYFTEYDEPNETPLGAERMVSSARINRFFSLSCPFMSVVVPRLVGFTIALEPKYCGGLTHSLHALDILNRQMFDGSLCTDQCRWRV